MEEPVLRAGLSVLCQGTEPPEDGRDAAALAEGNNPALACSSSIKHRILFSSARAASALVAKLENMAYVLLDLMPCGLQVPARILNVEIRVNEDSSVCVMKLYLRSGAFLC